MESVVTTFLLQKKRKIARAIFGTLSFSAALFIFQACYGTPSDMMMDNQVEGVVTSITTGLPIPGIKVSWVDQPYSGMTDQSGKFKFYLPRQNEYTLRFEDVDAALNGTYQTRDTVVKVADSQLSLQIRMDVR
ncbi:MAG TPA: hypothetical protein PKJ24_02805 [Prolixibacteraceae bacterium]|nr:hypothetical protein [Prolixibacteraceae bacterium]